MAEIRSSNLSPDDNILRFWTRQGVSLQEVILLIAQAKVAALQAQAALDAFTEGALSGVTELGQQLITAADQTAAKAALGITGPVAAELPRSTSCPASWTRSRPR